MNNLYNAQEHQTTINELKGSLLQLKEQYDDTDDKYPELVKVNENPKCILNIDRPDDRFSEQQPGPK
jgi:hypothetical protein